VSNNRKNNELERMWKEEVVTYFKLPSQYLPGGTLVNHGKPQSRQPSPGPPEYKAGAKLLHKLTDKNVPYVCREQEQALQTPKNIYKG
jgi:hypothetical protein